MSNSFVFFSGELPPESINGISYSNLSLLSHLKKKHTVIIDREVVDLKHHNKINLYKIYSLFIRVLNTIKISYKKKFNFFYIVFSNSLFGAIKTLIIIYSFRLFNKKTIVIVHIHRGDLESQIQKSNFFKLIFKIINMSCNKLIVLSNHLADYLKYKLYCENEIICLENTVFNEVNIYKEVQNRQFLNCVYISNYIEEKGVLILLDAFKKLGNNYKLNCYGSFSDKSLKNKILSFESENITINGPIYDYDKFSVISNSDLLVLPSYNEGKPLVLLESMMLGTPFISSRVGFIDEMIDSDYPYLLDNVEVDNLIQLVKKYSLLTLTEKKILSNSLINRYYLKFSNKIYFKNINQIFND